MATKVTLVDDLDGSTPATETVDFALDGVHYQIDLSTKNATKLREGLAQFVAAARKSGAKKRGLKRPAGVKGGTSATDREKSQAIRDWARQNGKVINPRGRIPADIVEAYNKQA